MKYHYSLALLIIMFKAYSGFAQCSGNKGPNLLGAKGSFSTPFITPNINASNCIASGAATYNPVDNLGNALAGCAAVINDIIPCSDYIYTSVSGGLGAEFRYSLIKNIGDANGGNCIKGDWRAKDHTGDGGYFMAVNGSPNTSNSAVFYQVKSIPVCVGVTYEFSAWVINILPAANPGPRVGTEPNISFRVNGVVIANSGRIAYSLNPAWVKVGGTFVATTNTVDLEVINATAVASGNDLGLDDISINTCNSNIEVAGNAALCASQEASVNFIVNDPLKNKSWYKVQQSIDGGITFSDITLPAQGTFIESQMTIPFTIGTVTNSMNGYKYRLINAASENGLSSPGCLDYNDYTLTVLNECGPTPVIMTSFTGTYSEGTAHLNWQTSQEINSDHFDVFRSNDGIDFYKVAVIPSAGFSNVVKNYSFQDKLSQQSNYYYYRLKQVDKNGKAVFSSIVRLSAQIKTNIDVYPNPFIDRLALTFSATKKSTASIQIYSNDGKLVYNTEIKVSRGSNTFAINQLSSLKSGTYYISIFNTEVNLRRKIVKL